MNIAAPARIHARLIAGLVAIVLAVTGSALTVLPAAAAPGDVTSSSATWGLSGYLTAGNIGRPKPVPDSFVAPATYNATAKTATWSSGTGAVAEGGTATLAYTGTAVVHAPTGGGWITFSDLQASIDATGNGTVSAVVAYGTSSVASTYSATDAPTRAGQRVNVVTLVGNTTAATVAAGSISWAALAGTWHADLQAFLAGDAAATPAIAAWTYASTITNTGAAERLPAPFAFTAAYTAFPTWTAVNYDEGVVGWGLSGYLTSGSVGRPKPVADSFVSPASYNAGSRTASFADGTGSIATNGSATLAYKGTAVVHAPTGGGWITFTDLQATLDKSGNGSVSAVVAYGTSSVAGTYSATDAAARGPERVTIVTLAGNAVAPVQDADSVSWSGLTGTWNSALQTFLAGDATATPAIPAWTYASTITNTGAAERLPAAFSFGLELTPPPTWNAVSYDDGDLAWGLSGYLTSGNVGRPKPVADSFVSPAVYDAVAKIATFGNGSGSIATNGSATVAYTGTAVVHAPTGGGWITIADVQATLDAAGNGVVSAVVAYGTSSVASTYNPADAPARAAQRVAIVTLAGNTVAPVQDADSVRWSGLTGTWNSALQTFLAGDSAATPAIPAWSYATTITNTGAAERLPAAFSFGLEVTPPPTYTATTYNNGDSAWGLSGYLTSGNVGRPKPVADSFISPAVYDAVAKIATFGNGSGSIATNGSATVAYKGTAVVHAPTGGGWITIADVQATLDATGNGVVSAVVAYGTSSVASTYNPADAPARAAQRVAIVTLAGNTAVAVQGADSVSWSGLAGTWNSALQTFLAGDSAAVPAIPAWSYATTITNTGAAERLPATFSFDLGITPIVTPTVTLSASPAAAVVGTSVTLTAAIAPAAAGTVQFRSGSTVLDSAPVASGNARLALPALAVGSYSFTAVYTPADSTAYASATSAALAYAVDAAVPAAAGSLTWGVKQSLQTYVLGGGSISTTSGAGTSGSNFTFPQTTSTSFNHTAHTGSSSYGGAVTFSYPAHGFSITLANPRVQVTSATAATLYADVTFNGTTRGGVAFATLGLGGATVSTTSGATTFRNVTATLTAAGATAFDGNYHAGDALDPLSFVVGSKSAGFASTTKSATPKWEAPATPPATTGLTVQGDDQPTEGGEVTVIGNGFAANEENIHVVIYSTPTELGTVTADKNGIATWTGALPEGLTGEHTLTLQGSVDRGVVLDILPASVDTAALEGCTVEDAALTWGFKESFRSYISGSIANGEWTVADGAAYTTPTFSWADGQGVYDAETATGELTFSGSITFTGHSGALNTTVANPVIRFDGPDSATILLDVSGTTQDGAEVSDTAVEFVELDLTGATVAIGEDGTVSVTDAPATLTSAGSAAFGTYETGEAFDAVSVEFSTAADCLVAAEPATTPVAIDDEPTSADLGWLVWVLLALVLLIAAAVVIVVVRRRRTV